MSASVLANQSLIDNALVNSEGEIQYEGTGGQKAILTNLNEAIRDKGTVIIDVDANGAPNTGALTSLSGGNARWAFVVDSGFYKYNSNGNVWELKSRAIQSPSVTAFGAGNITTGSITHNLDTAYPTVIIYQQSATATGLPYTIVNNSAISITVVDANNVSVTFPSATSLNHLIVIKP